MSDQMLVRTEAIISLAGEIDAVNREIEMEYCSTVSELRKMFNSWDGKASETAKTTFLDLETAFNDVRFATINQYVIFLKRCVGEGYDAVERVNISISDAFK